MNISAEVISKKTTPFNRQLRVATIAAMLILGSPLSAGANAADKSEGKTMDSAEMHKMEMQKSMKGMKDMVSMPMTGDMDHDFAMMMKKHHESAVEMANVELKHGKEATLRSMAKDIIKSQKNEIKEFDQWLAKHKQPMDDTRAHAQ